MDKDRTVRLRVAGNVFLPGRLLDDLAVFAEHLGLFAVVPPEVIVQGFPTDGTAHPRLPVLPEENNNVTIKIKFRRLIGERQFVFLKRPPHAHRYEGCERIQLYVDARTIQCGKIIFAVPHPDDRPRIPTGRQHHVH